MKVPNPPDSGKDTAEGKGVHREVESEGSRMFERDLSDGQISGLTNRNRIQVMHEGKAATRVKAQ